jgi:hypothetical protein
MTSQVSGQARFCLILASTAGGARWYASPDTMPPDTRLAFDRAMASPDCNTLVLASEEAAEHVARHIAEQGGELASEDQRYPRGLGLDLRLAIDLILLGGLGIALWCLATLR